MHIWVDRRRLRHPAVDIQPDILFTVLYVMMIVFHNPINFYYLILNSEKTTLCPLAAAHFT